MHSREEYALWQRLHDTVETSPQRFPVNEWRYQHPSAGDEHGAIDLWPLIKNSLMVRACHLFHSETERVLVANSIRRNEAKDPLRAPPSVWRQMRAAVRQLRVQLNARDRSSGSVDQRVDKLISSWQDCQAEIVFFGVDAGSYRVGGVRVQNHLDPIRFELEATGYRTAALLGDVRADAPTLGASLSGNTLGFSDELRAAQRVFPRRERFDVASLKDFSAWCAEISSIYPVDNLLTKRLLSDIVSNTYSSYLAFRAYFARQQIRAVFAYCYYSIAGYAAAAASRDLKLPCFDIQHGSAGPNHHCYNWPGMPESGYNTLPTHFLCWSDTETAAIQAHASKTGPRALTIGHSWRLTENMINGETVSDPETAARQKQARKAWNDDVIAAEARRKVREANGSACILVTLRPGEDTAWMKRLFDAELSSHSFLVRLHPSETHDPARLAQRRSELEAVNVEVERPSLLAMPLVLREVDVHITKYSSSVLDAHAYGIPSVCYSLSSEWFYNPRAYPSIRLVAADVEVILQEIALALAQTDESRPRLAAMTRQQLSAALTGEISHRAIEPE